MNVHILSIHNLPAILAVCVCGGVGHNLGVSREGQMKQQSYKTPASHPIRVKALVDSQWRSDWVAFDGGSTISLVTEQQR